jgi:NADPH:quinone reductase-like Zn-dependent oxidoreductase
MHAVQGSGHSCNKPYWSCISENLVLPDVPLVDQALIEMRGSSVNPINVDLVEPACEDLFEGKLPCSNGTLGTEGAGVVVATGANCVGLKKGDEVWGFIHGAYAQYAVANCTKLGLKPSKLGFINAGTVPVVGATSLQCLKATGMPSKKTNLTVVVTSGQGGTGFMAIQLAKALGATRVITAATGSGIDFVKALGADVVVDYHKQDLADALADDSVDIVFDNFGLKGMADKIMHSIRKGGTFLVLLGGNGGTISKHPKSGVRQVYFEHDTHANRQTLDELRTLFDIGKLHTRTMHPIYGLAEVPQAFTRLRSGGVLGKVAVVPSQARQSASMVV